MEKKVPVESLVGKTVDTPWHNGATYQYSVWPSGRRNRFEIIQFVEGVRTGVYDRGSMVTIIESAV